MLADTTPPQGTLERWAFDYVTADAMAHKLAPPPLPRGDLEASWELAPRARRALRPGRPASLVLAEKKPKTPTGGALRDPHKRALLLHVFLHHELQAAELFAWAMLSFVDAPRAAPRVAQAPPRRGAAHASLRGRAGAPRARLRRLPGA